MIKVTKSHTTNTDENDIVIDLPVRGIWKVIRMPLFVNHAFQLSAIDGWKQRTTDVRFLDKLFRRVSADSYHSWTKQIYAPISGTVVRMKNIAHDRLDAFLPYELIKMFSSPGSMTFDNLGERAGNHIIIHDDATYILLAHLQKGSVTVQTGESVERGELLASVGNSGRSPFPHLHLELLNLSAPAQQRLKIRLCYVMRHGKWVRVCNRSFQRGDIIRHAGAA